MALLKAADVARRLAMSVRWVQQAAERGEVPGMAYSESRGDDGC